MSAPELAPWHPACQHRHRPDLPCWRGQYARTKTAAVLELSRACWIRGPRCKGRATTADHVTPRAEGGDDAADNLRPACGPCNSARGLNPNPFSPDAEMRAEGVGLSPRWR